MKPNLYFTVNVLYSPDLIKRITIKASTPLDAIKLAHIHYPHATWFTVIGIKVMQYGRCCRHCINYLADTFMWGGICRECGIYSCEIDGGCEECLKFFCAMFKSESQTD